MNKINMVILLLCTTISFSHAQNTSCLTGEIDCSTDVNNAGDLTLNIPIKTYTDPSGIHPNLSINYNHNGSSGFLGRGWSLSGISIISRINKSMHYDGKVDGIKLNTLDAAFTLDGRHLVKTGINGSDITYKVDNDYIKAIGHVVNNNITSFTVYYSNGSHSNYVSSNYAYYYVSEFVDNLGNRVTYSYADKGNQKAVSSICYGRRLQNKVTFDYIDKTEDAQIQYIGGQPIVCTFLLSSVKTYINSTNVRTYDIKYINIQHKMLVSSINCNVNGRNLNPITFDYSKKASIPGFLEGGERKFKSVIDKSGENIYLSPALNSKGRSSLLYYKAGFPYCSSDSNGGIYNEYNPNDLISLYNSLDVDVFSGYYDNPTYPQPKQTGNPIFHPNPNYNKIIKRFEIKVGDGFRGVLSLRTTMTPQDDIIKINNYEKAGKDHITLSVYGSDLSYKYSRDFDLNTLVNGNVVPKKFISGDFNGDGKQELLVVTELYDCLLKQSNYVSQYYIIDVADNKIISSQVNNTAIQFYSASQKIESSLEDNINIEKSSDKLMSTDYDGDGKTDLMLINSNGNSLYSYNVEKSAFELVTNNTNFKKTDIKDQQFLAGDFNGDGKQDFIRSYYNKIIWTVYLSKGDGTYDSKDIALEKKQDDASYFVKDMNNDGISDIVLSGLDFIKTYLIYNNMSNGNDSGGNFGGGNFGGGRRLFSTHNHSFSETDNVLSCEIINSALFKAVTLIPFTDGNVSFIRLSDNGARTINFTQNSESDLLLTNVDKGNGEICEFGYKWLEHLNPKISYPIASDITSRRVCNSIKSYYSKDEKNTLQSVLYDFQTPYTNLEGLGFLGYEIVKKTNVFMSSKTDSVGNVENFITSNYDPAKMMSLVNTTASNNQRAEYNYLITTDANKWTSIKLASSNLYNDANGTVHSKTYEYDNYGNITQQIDNMGDGISQAVTSDYTNLDNNTQYILGIPNNVKTTNIRNDKSSTAEISYIYNSNYQPISKTTKNNNAISGIETYGYDNNNQIIEKVVTPNGGSVSLSEGYTYSADGLVNTKTDKYGHVTTYTYDNLNQPIIITDYKNHSVNNTYDALGRLVKVTTPIDLGITKTKVVEWSDYGKAAYKITRTETGKPIIIKYYNIYGEEIRTKTMDFDGEYIFLDKNYDRSGRLISESYPYKNTATSWKTYLYDAADRPLKVSTTTGQTTTYSYNGLTTTVDQNGKRQTSNYDVSGKIVSNIDAKGVKTGYEYNADGQPIVVTGPGNGSDNVTTSISYDALGRKTSVTDASHGTITYNYDDKGYISSIKDGKGNVTNYTTDRYGNPLSSTNSYIKTTYTYNSDNQIARIDNTTGNSKEYSYDTYLRPSTVIQSIGNNIFSQMYTYKDGIPSSIKYTTPLKIYTELYTYDNGYLRWVNAKEGSSIDGSDFAIGDKCVYRISSTNEMGQITEYFTGKIKHNKTYDIDGRLIGISAAYGDKILQNMSYTYNMRNDMLSRTDIMRNKREDFSYDELDRLVSYPDNVIGYDDKGNITNSSAGSYSYESSRPYALSSLKASNLLYARRDQNIGYNALDRISSITEADKEATFSYDETGKRTEMRIATIGTNDETNKYYFGDKCELKSDKSGFWGILYLGGDAYNGCAVMVDSMMNGHSHRYYILRDNLGSITKMVDENGNTIRETSYDAWGNLRDPNTWINYDYDSQPDLLLDRGYTGHEHLKDFDLVNMNARLYDPVLGRFLSPDPIVNMNDGQAMNLYNYAHNNPLMYVDKDGKFLGMVLGAAFVVGAWIGGSIANHNLNPAKWNWHSPDTYAGVIFGGLSGSMGSIAIAGGSIGYTFVAVTPIVSIGLTTWSNNGQWNSYTFYNTIAGGGMNSYDKTLREGANRAYDSVRENYKGNNSEIYFPSDGLELSDFISMDATYAEIYGKFTHDVILGKMSRLMNVMNYSIEVTNIINTTFDISSNYLNGKDNEMNWFKFKWNSMELGCEIIGGAMGGLYGGAAPAVSYYMSNVFHAGIKYNEMNAYLEEFIFPKNYRQVQDMYIMKNNEQQFPIP
jgi:RHS repeat-associated protein